MITRQGDIVKVNGMLEIDLARRVAYFHLTDEKDITESGRQTAIRIQNIPRRMVEGGFGLEGDMIDIRMEDD